MDTTQPTILHVIDTTGPGGAETVFLDLAEHANIVGHRKLALIKGPGWVKDQIDLRQIPCVVLKPFGFLSIPYYFSVARLCKKRNVRFIQAHLLGSALTASIISLITRIPAVATLHGQVDVGDRERFLSVKRWLLKHGLKKIVTVSQQLANHLESLKLFSADQVVVIHNGVDVSRFEDPPQTDIRSELGLDQDTQLVGSLGNIRPAKDYATLIRSAEQVVADNTKRHFVIAGHQKEPLQTQLSNLVDELNLRGHVHFLGFRNNTPDFLKQLDCFALSSKSEGFSIATLEAMAAKVPVVVTRSGGPEEIIRQAIDGVLVEKSDPDALASAINSVLNDKINCIEEAYLRVLSDFSMQNTLLMYQQISYDYLPNTEIKNAFSE